MSAANTRTKAVVRTLLATDAAVTAEQVRLVMEILDGGTPPKAPPGGPLGRVVHRREVMSLLGVCPRTVDNLRARGLLTPVYGIGRKVIGYTEASVRGLTEVGKTASRTEGGE